jgi:seryl-tRNA synthetase
MTETFAAELFNAGIFTRTSADGVVGWGRPFEALVQAIDRILVEEAKSQGAEERFFPPVLPREILQRTGYMEKFPQLCGSIHAFEGTDAEHPELLAAVNAGGDWSPFLKQTELAVCPAACYPLYPSVAGKLSEAGVRVCLWSYVFRREPSADPARRQIFRMREDIRIGSADQVRAWRARWMERGVQIFGELGLDVKLEVANDPFFGRQGRFLARAQRGDEAKFEMLAPIADLEQPTAVMSFNYHQDAFSSVFGIELPDGSLAQSGCLGVGMDRLGLAMLRRHGTNIESWPAAVRRRLWPRA